MTKPISHKVSHFLHKNSVLSTILYKTKKISLIEQILHPLLSDKIRPLCKFSNISGKSLTILVAHGAAATNLRYHIPILLETLQKESAFSWLTDIRIKVIPTAAPAARLEERTATPMPLLSAAVADIVLETAASIQDPGLRGIMERIANHRKS